MAADPRVRQLLEEFLDTERTPEEVCRDCPERLPEVRLRWQRLESIQALIGALLSEPASTSGATPRCPRIRPTIRRTSPATRWRRCSATAGRESSTGPSTADFTGCSRSCRTGNRLYGLAFSPDGTRLVIGCGDDTIRLWDVATRREVCQLRGHESYVHAVAFSPDGARLATASGDATVRLWDTVPPSLRAQPPDGTLTSR